MNINLQNVMSVYSGKQGACCCGCAGKRTYSKLHQHHGTKHRGYTVTDDEVSDRTVKLIVRKIEQAAAEGRIEFVLDEYVSAENEEGTRVWIAYFAKPDPEFVKQYGHLDRDEIRARKQAEAKLEQVAADLAWERSASVMR